MRKLVLQMQMSVDGFVGSDGIGNWQLWNWDDDNRWDAELKRDFNAHFQALDTILLSSRMAEEGYLDHWGRAARRFPADPFYAFAQRIVDVRKVVPSNRLAVSAWDRTEVRNGDLAQVIDALKAEPGDNIGIFGGTGLGAALLAAGLVDEMQFYVNPATLGAGTRLFGPGEVQTLRLLGSRVYDCGMVVSRYAPPVQSVPNWLHACKGTGGKAKGSDASS